MRGGGGKRRMERVNHLIREELSVLIQRELKDPRVAGVVSVTEVETAADLSEARVFVSVLGTPEEQRVTLQTLQRAAGFFRSMLAERLTTRTVPHLSFRFDESLERGNRVLELMREVEAESPVVAETGEPTTASTTDGPAPTRAGAAREGEAP